MVTGSGLEGLRTFECRFFPSSRLGSLLEGSRFTPRRSGASTRFRQHEISAYRRTPIDTIETAVGLDGVIGWGGRAFAKAKSKHLTGGKKAGDRRTNDLPPPHSMAVARRDHFADRHSQPVKAPRGRARSRVTLRA